MGKVVQRVSLLERLVLKDIIFNMKNFIISSLLSLGLYIVISFDTDSNFSIAMYMSLMILFSNYIGKSCLIEERDCVYDYLKILPLKKSYIVLAKYIGSLFIILISCVTFFIAKFILFTINKPSLATSINLTALIISIYIIYFSLYLVLFFRYSYSMAQNALLILFVGAILILKYFKNITYININMSYMVYILLVISLLLVYTSYKISENAFINGKPRYNKKIEIFKKFNLHQKNSIE